MPFYFPKFNLSVVYSNYVDQIVDWIIKCNWFNNLLTVQLTQNYLDYALFLKTKSTRIFFMIFTDLALWCIFFFLSSLSLFFALLLHTFALLLHFFLISFSLFVTFLALFLHTFALLWHFFLISLSLFCHFPCTFLHFFWINFALICYFFDTAMALL